MDTHLDLHLFVPIYVSYYTFWNEAAVALQTFSQPYKPA